MRILDLELAALARTPGEIEPMARDLIATWLETSPTAFDLDIVEG